MIARAKPDAVVIGAGPAGAVAALQLARRGFRTTLVERDTFPRPKLCGGCLARPGVDALERLGLATDLQLDRAPVVDSITLTTGARAWRVPIQSYRVIDRGVFDSGLVDAARHAGVTFLDGCKAKVLTDDSVALTCREGARTVLPSVVVVADGLGGTSLSDRDEFAVTVDPRSPIGFGSIVSGDPANTDPASVTMCAQGGSYVGLARLAPGRWIVAGALRSGAVRDAAPRELIRAALGDRAGTLGLDTPRWRGCAPVTRRRTTLASGRVVVVGDAAGYVEPFTGEGMSWAIRSASAIAPFAERIVAGETVTADWRDVCHGQHRVRHAVCRAVSSAARHPKLVSALTRVGPRLPGTAPIGRLLTGVGA